MNGIWVSGNSPETNNALDTVLLCFWYHRLNRNGVMYQEYYIDAHGIDSSDSWWPRMVRQQEMGPRLSQHKPSLRLVVPCSHETEISTPAPPHQLAEPNRRTLSVALRQHLPSPPSTQHTHRHRLGEPSSTMSNGESRESLDLLASAAEQSSPQSRIKRNTACVSCRDSKVRQAAVAVLESAWALAPS